MPTSPLPITLTTLSRVNWVFRKVGWAPPHLWTPVSHSLILWENILMSPPGPNDWWLCFQINCVTIHLKIINLEGHLNHITGSRVTASLWTGWIFPIGGASSMEGLQSTGYLYSFILLSVSWSFLLFPLTLLFRLKKDIGQIIFIIFFFLSFFFLLFLNQKLGGFY